MAVLPGNIVNKKCSSCSSVVAACNRSAEKMEERKKKAPLKDQMVRFDRRNCPIILTVIIRHFIIPVELGLVTLGKF